MTTLADVNNTEVIPGYHMNIDDHNGILILRASEDYGKRAKIFEHPNLIATRWTLNEYKYDMVYGTKWTQRAGHEYLMAVPLTAMEYDIPEKPGYSYIEVNINGAPVMLSVSGGSCGDGWSDYSGPVVYICRLSHCNLKKIADIALDPAKFKVELPEPRDADSIRYCLAEVEARKALAPGMKVVLGWGLSFENNDKGARAIRSVNRRRRSVIVDGAWSGVKVKYSQIDWLKTARENNIELPEVLVKESA